MARLNVRIVPTRGTLAALNARTELLEPGERWVVTDPEDDDHVEKHGAATGDKTFAECEWYTTGTGTGSGVPDDTGPKGFAYTSTGSPEQPERLDPEDLATALGLAMVSSTDDRDTLSTVGETISDHIAVGETDFTQSAHGLWPAATLQANILNQRVKLYVSPTSPITSLPSGNAPAGEGHLLFIGSGAFKGLWYRDDSHPFEKIAPGEAFTPYQRLAMCGRNTTWTNMPAGLAEFLGDDTSRVPVQLWEDDGETKRYSQGRIGINRISTAGASGARLFLCYFDGTGLDVARGVDIAVTQTASTDLFAATAHGLAAGDPVMFNTITGSATPAPRTLYFVIASGLTANAFKVSATDGGATINVDVNGTANVRKITPLAIDSTGTKFQSPVDFAPAVYARETSAGLTVLAVQGYGGDGAIDPILSGAFVDVR